MAHVAEIKKTTVSEFVKLIDEYPIIGAVNMQNMPTKQLQNMRALLREKSIVLKMTKRRLMKIAFKQTKKQDIDQLIEYLEGMPALIFTKENPFKLSSLLNKNKSTAPAKAGQVAPNNVTVNAGPTPFAPGPIISQLAKVGIQSTIEGGKIVIKQDAVVAKKGEVISAELAGILSRLGIEPMEIGLDLVAVYENGTIFKSDILSIDESVYKDQLSSAASMAQSLALEIVYVCDDTISLILGKAAGEARALVLSADVITKDMIGDLLAKAESQMSSLSCIVYNDGSATEEATQSSEEPKEEKPQEKEPEADAAAGLGSLFG